MSWLFVLVVTAAAPTDRVDASKVGQPWGTSKGLLQFRGNPTHTWYGQGPLPTHPKMLWRFPKEPMCSYSVVGSRELYWCGTGWTGQPAVWERKNGTTEVIFGAYDKKVHFLDANTGRRVRPDFTTGDIIKGSVTVDPDGYPLLYFGSRDNRFRVLALDRKRPRQLWAINARDYPTLHNNDWDGNASVVDGILYEGGENGWFYAVELNRGYDSNGKVTVAPEIKVALQGWNDELLAAAGDRKTDIESSVALFEDRAFFANSLGRIVGVDVSGVRKGNAEIVFDFWAGDDVDASLVIDELGFLYGASEIERMLPRGREVGQLFKLDPTQPNAPLVWSLAVAPGIGDHKGGGIWSTPALHGEYLYVTSQSGRLMVVHRDTGKISWEEQLGRHLWSSPVVVGDELLVATCEAQLRAYSLLKPDLPALQWTLPVGRTRKCVESTPAVWKSRIYVGMWDGYFYAFGDGEELAKR